MRSTDRQIIAEVVDRVLSGILLADYEWTDPRSNAHLAKQTSNAALAALWGADFHLLDEAVERIAEQPWLVLLPQTGSEAAALFWPLDVAIVVPETLHEDIVTSTRQPAIWFRRIASVAPAEVRGLIKLVPQKIMSLSEVSITSAAPYSDQTIIGLVADKWQKLPLLQHEIIRGGQRYALKISGGLSDDSIHRTILLCAGLRLSARYLWHVALGFSQTGPRVLLPTGPRGAMALLQNRELEPGRSRRQAIRHWVSEHWRDNSADDEALIYIRQHLRGHTAFIWNGLFAEVLVSEFDLERNEMFKHEAALWRSQRKHNQVKLRVNKWVPPPPSASQEVWY